MSMGRGLFKFPQNIAHWEKNNKGFKEGEAVERNYTDPSKGRTIRKFMGGGGGEVQKKYSRKGKLKEKKFMHAN